MSKPVTKSKAKPVVKQPKGPGVFKDVKNPHPGSKRKAVPEVVSEVTVIRDQVKAPVKYTPGIALNVPSTSEQKAGIASVISGDSFEGVKRIDHLPIEEQMDTVFNPLHTITKTTVSQAVSESTFIVQPTKK